MLKLKRKLKGNNKVNVKNKKYLNNFLFFFFKLKKIFFFSYFKFKIDYFKLMRFRRKRYNPRKGVFYLKRNFFFVSDIYDIYFFFLWKNRYIKDIYLNILKKKKFFLEVKGSLNNLFINLYVIKKGKKKLIYYISSGMCFRNSSKSAIFASIKLSDILVGFVKYKKIKNIMVFLHGLDYKIIKFFKLFGLLKKNKKYKLNLFFFFVKMKFIFNGVRLKSKRRV
jgi:hypothetical protein